MYRPPPINQTPNAGGGITGGSVAAAAKRFQAPSAATSATNATTTATAPAAPTATGPTPPPQRSLPTPPPTTSATAAGPSPPPQRSLPPPPPVSAVHAASPPPVRAVPSTSAASAQTAGASPPPARALPPPPPVASVPASSAATSVPAATGGPPPVPAAFAHAGGPPPVPAGYQQPKLEVRDTSVGPPPPPVLVTPPVHGPPTPPPHRGATPSTTAMPVPGRGPPTPALQSPPPALSVNAATAASPISPKSGSGVGGGWNVPTPVSSSSFSSSSQSPSPAVKGSWRGAPPPPGAAAAGTTPSGRPSTHSTSSSRALTPEPSPQPQTSPVVVTANAKSEEERRQLCDELVSTERSYGKMLKSVIRGIMLRLEKYDELSEVVAGSMKPLMDARERQCIFLNLPHLWELQQKLYGELRGLQSRGELVGPALGLLLQQYAPFFRIYSSYCSSYADSSELLRKLREERPALDLMLRHCELVQGARVADFMISPVQRVPRYALLLRALAKVTPTSELDCVAAIHGALDLIESVALDINNSFSRGESRAKILSLASLIEGVPDSDPLVTPHRIYIREGALTKRYNNSRMKLSESKMYQFFLFNDLIMYTTLPSASGRCKMKYSLPLREVEVAELAEENAAGSAGGGAAGGGSGASSASVSQFLPELSFELRGPIKSFVVVAASPTEKREWLCAIREAKANLAIKSATLKKMPSIIQTTPSNTAAAAATAASSAGGPNLSRNPSVNAGQAQAHGLNSAFQIQLANQLQQQQQQHR